jgi:hypothetical protein
VTALDDIAARGIDTCRVSNVDALRQTTFGATPVKELSIVAPDGRTLCTDVGNQSAHIFAVELDTIFNAEFRDINSNHVGIDVNSLVSLDSTDAGYYDDGTGRFQNLNLISRKAMQVWVDYDGTATEITVTMAPLGMARPKKPLLQTTVDLSGVVQSTAYVGFSSSTGILTTRHFVVGWSFALDGPAPALDIPALPALPRAWPKPRSKVLEIVLPLASAALVLAVGIGIYVSVQRRLKYSELREDWEEAFGPHRFSYKELFHATKGFSDKNLIGAGGFGSVYRGKLRKPANMEVAVKRVSHESRQGMKEFVAEVASIGRLRHRNLVPLLGYCRRKGELLLVYDYMPNRSACFFWTGLPAKQGRARARARGCAPGRDTGTINSVLSFRCPAPRVLLITNSVLRWIASEHCPSPKSFFFFSPSQKVFFSPNRED